MHCCKIGPFLCKWHWWCKQFDSLAATRSHLQRVEDYLIWMVGSRMHVSWSTLISNSTNRWRHYEPKCQLMVVLKGRSLKSFGFILWGPWILRPTETIHTLHNTASLVGWLATKPGCRSHSTAHTGVVWLWGAEWFRFWSTLFKSVFHHNPSLPWPAIKWCVSEW